MDSGNSDDLKDNVFNTKFQYPEGEVKEINEKEIIITLPNGDETKIERRTALQSLNDVAVWSEPKVKVGDKVKQGDIITGAHEITKDTVKSGLNTFVLYSAYKGLVHEDAVVVSESYADRMMSYGVIDLSIDVKTSTSLKWIAPIGTRVKSKDSIVTLYKGIQIDKLNELMQKDLGTVEKGDSSKHVIEQHLIVPNNIEDAIVTDVMVQENVKPIIPKNVKAPDYTVARESKKVIDEYMKNIDRTSVYEKFPEYVASDRLKPIEIDRKNYKTVYTIRVRLIKIHRLTVADKLTNRSKNPGRCKRLLIAEISL